MPWGYSQWVQNWNTITPVQPGGFASSARRQSDNPSRPLQPYGEQVRPAPVPTRPMLPFGQSQWAQRWSPLQRSIPFGHSLLGALSGLGALSLSTDRAVYAVGEKPVYLISGATPDSQIAWSSFFNEGATGEFNVIYPEHPHVGADGTATIEGGAWTAGQAGRWEKEVVIIAPDGTMTRAETFFIVSETPPGAAPPPSSGGILSSSVNLFGYDVPIIGLGIGALILFFALRKK